MNNEKLCKCNELSRDIRILQDQLRIAKSGIKIKSTIEFYNKSAGKYEELNAKFVDFDNIKAIAIQHIENELKSKIEEFEDL